MAPTDDGLSAQQINILSNYREGDPDPICDLFPVTTCFPPIRKAFHAGRVERAIHLSQEAIELHGLAIKKHLNSPVTRSIPEGRALAGLVKTIAFLANNFEEDWETKKPFRSIANVKALPDRMVPPGQWRDDVSFPSDRNEAIRLYTKLQPARSIRTYLERPKSNEAKGKGNHDHQQGGIVSSPRNLRSQKRPRGDEEAPPDQRPTRRTKLPPLQCTEEPVPTRAKSTFSQRHPPSHQAAVRRPTAHHDESPGDLAIENPAGKMNGPLIHREPTVSRAPQPSIPKSKMPAMRVRAPLPVSRRVSPSVKGSPQALEEREIATQLPEIVCRPRSKMYTTVVSVNAAPQEIPTLSPTPDLDMEGTQYASFGHLVWTRNEVPTCRSAAPVHPSDKGITIANDTVQTANNAEEAEETVTPEACSKGKEKEITSGNDVDIDYNTSMDNLYPHGIAEEDQVQPMTLVSDLKEAESDSIVHQEAADQRAIRKVCEGCLLAQENCILASETEESSEKVCKNCQWKGQACAWNTERSVRDMIWGQIVSDAASVTEVEAKAYIDEFLRGMVVRYTRISQRQKVTGSVGDPDIQEDRFGLLKRRKTMAKILAFSHFERTTY
ncbi:hypothetical protein NMY22_g2027 [Coprinellus aureogranulatus]|nr:hypothetical protein NMY22_g2027 [Coprinellus aureogranulatus]